MGHTITAPIILWDRLTRTQKVFIILRDNPELRDSYDLIISQYYKENPTDWVTRSAIERDVRAIQYDMGIYPPSERTRRKRKEKQAEIIKDAKARKKNLLARAWDFIRLK